MDLRKTLFSNIVLSGGSTLFKGLYSLAYDDHLHHAIIVSAGFGDRLLSETKKLAPKDIKIKV